ncbi:ABC transporter ATP-binding protein [SAR202 cluster bacterium AD-804-J14_MRT_500m]|nr:ABC transporter ATP-binding protein [SAR202 cluster bacterium AD-804-J14_MRT_500m]
MQALLDIRELHTYFHTDEGVVKAVNGVSFSINRGETFGLVGESGSGKSVTALSILGLVSFPGRIESGSLMFQGEELSSLSENGMRRIRGNRIAMVFQEPMTSLNPVLTIERQLTEAMEAHLGIGGRTARSKAVELLDRVGIPDPKQRMKDFPHMFSGGMRQRVMIAIALSCTPDLIIADEPTTAVDVTIQAQILELMKDVTREANASLLIISHDLGVVARYADRVAIMYSGKIVEQAPVIKIFKRANHPYTRGLLKSIPRLDEPTRLVLETIPGQPPDLTDLPLGCAFEERCQFASAQCGIQVPPLMEVDQDHLSACWEFQAINQ